MSCSREIFRYILALWGVNNNAISGVDIPTNGNSNRLWFTEGKRKKRKIIIKIHLNRGKILYEFYPNPGISLLLFDYRVTSTCGRVLRSTDFNRNDSRKIM